jgi:hypothetical protein
MFKWFDNWFAKKCKEAWENSRNDSGQDIMVSAKNSVVSTRGRSIDGRGMNFTIHSANGGYVMEYSKYDEKTDRNTNTLHIINSDQDLGQGIAHVITLEMLRN